MGNSVGSSGAQPAGQPPSSGAAFPQQSHQQAQPPHQPRGADSSANLSQSFLKLLELANEASQGRWALVLAGINELRAAGAPECPHSLLLEGLALAKQDGVDPQTGLLAALHCFLRGLQLCAAADPELVRAIFPSRPALSQARKEACCDCDAQYMRMLRWNHQQRRPGPAIFPFASPVSPLVQPDTPYPGVYGFSQAQELAYRLRPRATPGSDNWITLELAKCYCQILQTAKRCGWRLEVVTEDIPIRLDEEQARLAVLEAWLRKNGCRFPHLRLSDYNNEARGVHAATDIAPQERVLDVPLRLLITTEVASSSPLARRIAFKCVNFASRHTPLALYLLEEREKGVQSFWYPYLCSLPQEYGFMPAFFSEPELDWLRGSFALKKIAEQLQGFVEEYRLAVRAEPQLARFSLQDFMWGRFAIVTRIFGMNIQNRETQGLVPYADMLNHKFPKQTLWNYDNLTASFAITALTPIAAGQQVFDTYGRKCNSRYLVNYGFVLDGNEEDNEAQMVFEIRAENPGDPLAAAKCELLWVRSGCRRVYQVPADCNQEKTLQMLGFLRVVFAERDADLSWIRHNPATGNKITKAFRSENEFAMLMGLKSAAVASLAKFPDSLVYDVALLRGPLQQLQMLENDADAQGKLVDAPAAEPPQAPRQASAEEEVKDPNQDDLDIRVVEDRAASSETIPGDAGKARNIVSGAYPGYTGPWMLDHLGQWVPRSTNFRNSVVQRSGEKRVLSWFAHLSDLGCSLLLLRRPEQQEIVGLLRTLLQPPPPAAAAVGNGDLPQRRPPLEGFRKRVVHMWWAAIQRHPGMAARLGARPPQHSGPGPRDQQEETQVALSCPLLQLNFDLFPLLFDAGSRQRWLQYLEEVVLQLPPMEPEVGPQSQPSPPSSPLASVATPHV